jgi:hypothetical protein
LSIGPGIGVHLPHGWQLARREVSPYLWRRRISSQPAVIASFPVVFGRHPCPCAHPNFRNCGAWCEEPSIVEFPKAGAIVFLWEELSPRNPADLGHGFVFRPTRFRVAQKDPHFAQALARELRGLHRQAGRACVEGPGSHPSWWSDFREAGRAFQLEVYLGPAAGPSVRARMEALLDSLEIARLRPGIASR